MARADITTPFRNNSERYSDFLVNFDKNPSTGNLAKVVDSEAIKQAIKLLILTDQGERFYGTIKGSKLKSLLFEPANADTADLIRTTISQTIRNNEPRVDLVGIEVFDFSDYNAYKVNIFFSIINTNENVKLDIILKRAR